MPKKQNKATFGCLIFTYNDTSYLPGRIGPFTPPSPSVAVSSVCILYIVWSLLVLLLEGFPNKSAKMKYHMFQKIKSQKPGSPASFVLGVTTMFSEGLLNFLGSM